jgi:hypothetical protein|tara:strand:+ start:952 stop:1146 length:195 start_codon:yes stop_codon:yes gene_type:complete
MNFLKIKIKITIGIKCHTWDKELIIISLDIIFSHFIPYYQSFATVYLIILNTNEKINEEKICLK